METVEAPVAPSEVQMKRESDNQDPVVKLTAVAKSFRGHLGIGRTHAVRGLDLEVRPGEIFGLLGPNGAGKTTTFKLLVGLLRPDRGEIRLLGESPQSAAVRSRVGYLPENPYFYDHLTAREFLDFYARLRGMAAAERKRRIESTLIRVGLGGREDVALRKFSKGMVQRVGLAQAVQHDPELVILDEPMSGLDPRGRREVRDLILALRGAGRSVIFSSHILQDAEMICDRVAILQAGRMRSMGRLDDLVRTCVEGFEISVRTSSPEKLKAQLISRDGEHCLMRVGDVDELSRFLAEARETTAEVTSVWPKRQTLEDLFLEQIGDGDDEGRP